MNSMQQGHFKPKSFNSYLIKLVFCWFALGCQQPQSTITEDDLFSSWSASQADGKPIFIDFYTDWCGPCKIMDKEVYSDTSIGNYLKENYHAIKFNPEKVRVVEAFGDTFKLDKNLRANTFINFATRHQFRGYPTAVILSSEGHLLWMSTGTMTKGEMLKALKAHAVN